MTTSSRPRPPKNRAGRSCRSTKRSSEERSRIDSADGRAGFSLLERVGRGRRFEVHGIAGGFTGAGAKTVIPGAATAKVSMRWCRIRIRKRLSRFQEVRRRRTRRPGSRPKSGVERGPAIMVNPDHPAIHVAARAFAISWARSPRCSFAAAGRFPSWEISPRTSGIPTILMGFGLPDDGLHSPNEKYKLANYYAGIMTIAHFFEQYGAGRGQ
jgi:acetylornithine deacetylase/succinyl-diaminopimelate desuccinylase-like protein